MDFLELIQAVNDLSADDFALRFRQPFLLEETGATPVRVAKEEVPSARRVFEVARRDRGAGDVLIGRSPSCDLRIEDPKISMRHAELKAPPSTGGGTWALRDLMSTNGCSVDGKVVSPGGSSPLPSGGLVGLGPSVRLTFLEPAELHSLFKPVVTKVLEALKAAGPPTTAPGATPATGTAGSPVTARRDKDEPEMVARCDPLPPTILPQSREIFVGRTPPIDIVLPHSSVSRRHATLTRQGMLVIVRDLGSANGTYIGVQRVQGKAFVEPGGPPILIGPYEVRIELRKAALFELDPRSEATAPIRPPILRTTLETMPLSDFLQAVELNSRTGSVRIETPEGETGEIVFVDGEPYQARFETDTGETAILRVLALAVGTLIYSPDTSARRTPRSVDATFTKMLLEASRRQDETSR